MMVWNYKLESETYEQKKKLKTKRERKRIFALRIFKYVLCAFT